MRIPNDWTRTPGRFFPGLVRDSTLDSTTPLPPPPCPFTVLPEPAGPHASLMAPSNVSRWRFSKSSMERLKSDLSPSGPTKEYKSDIWISSGDALAALLCGVITRARNEGHVARIPGRSTLESQTEKLVMTADCYDRCPQGTANGQYFGNFFSLWSATVSRSDLLSTSLDSASRVALAIRHNLNLHLSPEAIGEKISFFEDARNTQPAGRITWLSDIVLSNWCCFDLQGPKLDFGWGKPFAGTDGDWFIPCGACIMKQEKDSADVFVMISIELECADRLKADSMLNEYATCIS